MKRQGKFTAGWYQVLSMAIGTLFLGTGLTTITAKPPVAMVGVTLMAALAGARAMSLRRGLIRGVCVGLLGGAAIVFALNHVRVQDARRAGPPKTPATLANQPSTSSPPTTGPGWEFRPQWVVTEAEVAAVGATTVVMSIGAAGVFAWAAKRRREMVG